MSTPVSNPTAKARFLQSGDNISKHRDMVDSATFQRACDFAMLQFSLALTQAPIEPSEMSLGASGLKLKGAYEFLSILRNLSEAPQAPTNIIRPANLNHAI